MNAVLRGRFSRFTHESKFTDRINTKVNAENAIKEGDDLRLSLSGRHIIAPSKEWELNNAFRL